MSETPYRILVVDDNDLNRDLLVRQLERKEYKVLMASDGRQALELINLEPVRRCGNMNFKTF
jgi:CheY-like chemotaxis protein